MKKFILCAAVLGLFACNSSTENGYTVNVALKGDPKDLASDTLRSCFEIIQKIC